MRFDFERDLTADLRRLTQIKIHRRDAESAENFSFVCRERATNKTLAIADNNRTTKRKAIIEEGQQVFVFFTPTRSEARIELSA